MSTWQMFSDAGNTFRWEISYQRLPSEEAQPNGALAKQPPPQAHCLPSMADLLLQGSGRLMEFRQGNIPSFRTALGKSVAVKQSSICRASAILRDEGDQVLQTGCSKLPKVRDGNLDNAPIFRTGLGKSVGVKHSSISRALAILGDGGEVIRTGQQSEGENGFSYSNTMSWTGSRKETKIPKSAFKTGLEKATDSLNSLFQTASDKMVSISSAGLLRAETLLGSEENGDHKNFEYLEQESNLSISYEPIGLQSSFNFEVEEAVANIPLNGDTVFPIAPLDTKFNSLRCESKEVIPDFVQTAPKSPPIKFRTAGGRSISVSSDALQRARGLLGDQEEGAYPNEGDATNDLFSIFRDRESKNTTSNKENDPNTPFPYQGTGNGKSLSNKFMSPLRSTSCQKQSLVRLHNIGQGSNMIKKFEAEAYCIKNGPHFGFPTYENPFNNRPQAAIPDLLENGIASNLNSSERPLSGTLVDISNSIVVGVKGVEWNSGEKRRLGRSIIPPFKRPRKF